MSYPVPVRWSLGEVRRQLGELEAHSLESALTVQKTCGILSPSNTSLRDYQSLAHQHQLPFVDLNHFTIQYAALCSIPYRIIHHYQIIPIMRRENMLMLAISHPRDRLLVFFIQTIAKVEQVQIVLASPTAISTQIEKCYGTGLKAA